MCLVMATFWDLLAVPSQARKDGTVTRFVLMTLGIRIATREVAVKHFIHFIQDHSITVGLCLSRALTSFQVLPFESSMTFLLCAFLIFPLLLKDTSSISHLYLNYLFKGPTPKTVIL